MLSPVINNAEELLTQALNEIMQLDNYAKTSNNIILGKLPKDPAWLSSVRSRVGLLSKAGASWIAEKPDIWSSILVQFPHYASSFSAIADQQSQGLIEPDQWVPLLKDVLYSQLVQAVEVTTKANDQIQAEEEKFKDIQPLLEESIKAGWDALASEEQQMVKIAKALTQLQDEAGSLEDSITSSMISDGKSIIQSSVTTIYKLVSTTAPSISYLSILTSAFTVGKMYYDIISNSEKIAQDLKKIGELQLEATEEAQAAAGTENVLKLLYNLEKSFLAIQDVVPQIISMWKVEQGKVQEAIEALESGANPDDFFEILTIPTANENWQAINKFALAISKLECTIGKPVILDLENTAVTTSKN